MQRILARAAACLAAVLALSPAAAKADERVPTFVSFLFRSEISTQLAPIAGEPLHILDARGVEVDTVRFDEHPAWTIVNLRPGAYRACWDPIPGFETGCEAFEVPAQGTAHVTVDLRRHLIGSYALGYVSCTGAWVTLQTGDGQFVWAVRAIGHPRTFSYFVFGGLADGVYSLQARYGRHSATRAFVIQGGAPVENISIGLPCES